MKQHSEAEVRWPKKIRTLADAARFIDAVGYCLLFPAKNVPLPSPYFALAHRQPVTWDWASEKLWDWKDNLPRKRRAFYGKYFKGRGTFISLKLLPHFLTMHRSAVAPADHARFYAEGRIRDDARAIWEALAKHGPLPTLELRQACRMDTVAGNKRFKRAMLDLQRMLLVVHFGAAQETAAWASGRFELTCRAFSEETSAARKIAPQQARAAIASKYFAWRPKAPARDLGRLFGWSKAEILLAMEKRECD